MGGAGDVLGKASGGWQCGVRRTAAFGRLLLVSS
jgi:hypothetical protein